MIANMRNFDEFKDSAGTEASSAATCTDRVTKFPHLNKIPYCIHAVAGIERRI